MHPPPPFPTCYPGNTNINATRAERRPAVRRQHDGVILGLQRLRYGRLRQVSCSFAVALFLFWKDLLDPPWSSRGRAAYGMKPGSSRSRSALPPHRISSTWTGTHAHAHAHDTVIVMISVTTSLIASTRLKLSLISHTHTHTPNNTRNIKLARTTFTQTSYDTAANHTGQTTKKTPSEPSPPPHSYGSGTQSRTGRVVSGQTNSDNQQTKTPLPPPRAHSSRDKHLKSV